MKPSCVSDPGLPPWLWLWLGLLFLILPRQIDLLRSDLTEFRLVSAMRSLDKFSMTALTPRTEAEAAQYRAAIDRARRTVEGSSELDPAIREGLLTSLELSETLAVVQEEAVFGTPTPAWRRTLISALATLGNWLGNLMAIPDLLIAILPLTCLLTILLPHARGRYLEHKYRLTAPDSALPYIAEIESFVRRETPKVEIRVNLLRAGMLAFVYPAGFRQPRLALFGGFIRLWLSDRLTAEGILLHELAHLRRGDHLIVGAGSLFETFLKYLPLVVIVAAFAGWPLLFMAQLLDSYEFQRALNEMASLVSQTADRSWLWQFAKLEGLHFIGLLAITIPMFFQALAFLVVPILAIWSAEFNADQLAARQQNSAEGVLQGLSKTSGTLSWWRRLWLVVAHPPRFLRRFSLRHPDGIWHLALLLVFPFAFVAQWLCLLLFAVSANAGSAERLGELSGIFFRNTRLVFALLCLTLLLWPFVAPSWERFHAHRLPEKTPLRKTPYFASAALFGCVYLALAAV